MNNLLFDQAVRHYRLRDYRSALTTYTLCLQDQENPLQPGEEGLLYHQIGNCLIKMKNPLEAIHAYTQATADPDYQAEGTVECNLGMAYASLRDYDNAIACFEQAVADETNPGRYKAYMGIGTALMKLGKSAEAGVAFREAALDEDNPDPTKALLNLGVCFMALGRPADAIASYESALPFDAQGETRNKLYASLGQAYVACDMMEEAVDAFEQAIADKTYFLSDSASVDYQRAVGAVAQGLAQTSSEKTALLPVADMSGLDIAADGSTVSDYDTNGYGDEPFYYDEPYTDQNYPGYYDAYGEGEDQFFNATDAELEQWSKGLAKQDRKRRNVGLKVLVVIVVLLLLACAAAVFAYTQGYGYPTQQQVVESYFADPTNSAMLADSVNDDTKSSIEDIMVQDSAVTIDGVNQSMSDSTVYVTAATPEGGSVDYRVTLVRDLIGWKISGVELYFPSQN